MRGVCVACVLVVAVVGVLGASQQYCPDLKPQRSLDLDQLMGIWYAVEIVEHLHSGGQHAASVTIDVCPVLHLSRDGNDHLRLLWDEKAGMVLYHFNIPVKTSPGFWIANSPQNGSLTTNKNYNHFTGTAQVMKAVGSHMVLTMCARQENQVMSVVMSRETTLDRQEIISVNNMLQRRGLAMGHIRDTCRSAATTLQQSLAALAVVIITRVLHA